MFADNPYTSFVGLYLVDDSSAFPASALWWRDQRPDRVTLFGIRSAEDMLTPAEMFEDRSVRQIAVFSHGTTTGVGKPGRWGIDTRPVRWDEMRFGGRFISPSDFAEVWAPKLDKQGSEPIISLGACLCSRAPRWYRIQLWGRDFSSWGPKAYRPGGQKSMANVLCEAFHHAGRRVRVRGHCAAGHTIWQALLREHITGRPVGESLFSMTMPPGTEPTLVQRRKWQRYVKGDLAAKFLLDLDTPVAMDEIRHLMSL